MALAFLYLAATSVQAMAETRDSILDVWGPRTPHEDGIWPVRIDVNTAEAPDLWVQSACVLCSNGCACDIGVKKGRIVGVRGRAADRVNKGRLGPKGLHGWTANQSGDRLTRPLIRRDGDLAPATWDAAMNLVVERTKEIRDRYTASAIGFYTSGQLFLEEYYTLGVIGKAGLGTPHMDGNTRLCTATAAAALKETFGSDGQPGSYRDIDLCDTLLLVGHNMAETQTVLWSRILDRRAAPNPPRLIVVDPRCTATAREADVHLAPRVGTNVAVLNGLLHLLIDGGQVDRAFVERHTTGFDAVAETASEWPPNRVAEVTGIPVARLREAARIIGDAERLLSTCLQGVYQSMQATAAAVQVNNINIIRGMIGKPGAGILQMNGQPTAQNTRETGADGDLPGFRNWENPDHIEELARIWNVDRAIIPHWAPPTHALQIFRYCETGSIRMLWISGTNPAVSLPNLARIREILKSPELFVVVQDAFPTETTELADVVLPAALWGEKTGCFTNVDRTVHLSLKAIEPPGEAKSDLDIWLDYARRMGFRDKDGAPLIKWRDPESAFEAWKACSKGRPCDYSGMSYAKLTGGSGIQWPCNEEHPDGAERLYADHRFATEAEFCETFGHDLTTGATVTPDRYRASAPEGRAILKPAEFQPPHEQPDREYPFFLSTGRVVYHFHTRTKTGRSKPLNDAAAEPFVELSAADADRLGVNEGDMVRLVSRRGTATAPARIGEILDGHLFMPFHYGYWDEMDPAAPRAANELTIYEWDPVSKQPHYKYAAVRLEKVEAEGITEHASGVAGMVGTAAKEFLDMMQRPKPPRAHIADYIGLLDLAEQRLANGFDRVRTTHPDEPDVGPHCSLFAEWSRAASTSLQPFAKKYGERRHGEPERLDEALLKHRTATAFDLLRDLQDLWLMNGESHVSVVILMQAAQGLRDDALLATLKEIAEKNERQRAWLLTRLKQAAPQTLVVPS